MTEGKLEQITQPEKTGQTKPQEKQRDNLLLENRADLAKLFELFMKIDRRVNLTGSYETQNNGSPNNTN